MYTVSAVKSYRASHLVQLQPYVASVDRRRFTRKTSRDKNDIIRNMYRATVGHTYRACRVYSRIMMRITYSNVVYYAMKVLSVICSHPPFLETMRSDVLDTIYDINELWQFMFFCIDKDLEIIAVWDQQVYTVFLIDIV